MSIFNGIVDWNSIRNNIYGKAKSISNEVLPTSSKSSSYVPKEGDVFKGEILNISNNNEVTVRLDNDQTITLPATKDNTELIIGGRVSFEVVSDNNGGLLLRPLTEQLPPSLQTIVDKALLAAYLPKTIKNQEIVKQLLQYNLSIDKQSISNLLKYSLQFPKASVNTLAFMQKIKMPMTKEHIFTMEMYKNNEHRLVQEINQFSNSISNILDNISANNKSTLYNFNLDLLNIILGDNNGLQDSSFNSSPMLNLSQEELLNLKNILSDFPMPQNVKDGFLTNILTLDEVVNLINTDKELAHSMDEVALAKQMELGEVDVSKLPLSQDKFNDPIIHSVFDQLKQFQIDQGYISANVSKNDTQLLSVLQKELPVSDSIKQMIQSQTITGKNLLYLVKSYFPLLSEETKVAFLTSDLYKSLVKDQLKNDLTIPINQLSTKDFVPEYYEHMNEQLEKLQNLCKNHSQDANFLQNSATAKALSDTSLMQNNLDFMKSLNELFTYVQLPVCLKNQNLHSELYVYTNKNDLKKNNHPLRALLHLDLDSLGSLDVHVTLNENQISSEFYLEKEDSINLIKTNLPLLNDVLTKKGFSFQYDVIKSDTDKENITNWISKELSPSSLMRYSFDIRA